MKPLDKLVVFLNETIRLENKESIETLAGYIVGELIGDYDGVYEGLMEKYPDIERIADLASDLEWSNGAPNELEKMWQEIKQLTTNISVNHE